MKLTTVTLIFIRAIKLTQQSIESYGVLNSDDRNIGSKDARTQDSTSNGAFTISTDIDFSLCEMEILSDTLNNETQTDINDSLRNEQKRMLEEYTGNPSRERKLRKMLTHEEKEAIEDFNLDLLETIIPKDKNEIISDPRELKIEIDKKVPETESVDAYMELTELVDDLESNTSNLKQDLLLCFQSLQERKSTDTPNTEEPSKKITEKNHSSTSYSNDLPESHNPALDLFCKSINSHMHSEHIWDLVKTSLIDQENMCIDFSPIQTVIKAFNTEGQNKVKGYYDGFFDDLADYIKQHKPKAITKQQNEKGTDKNICKHTPSDLYMKHDLNNDTINEYVNSEKEEDIGKSLPEKIQTIFNVPEIHKDLASISGYLFEGTLLKSLNPDDDSFTPMQLALLRYLYGVLHCNESQPKNKMGACTCNKHLSILEEKTESSDRDLISYSTQELYIEAYKAMTLFYKHSPYYYENENTKDKTLSLMRGKDIVVDQTYIKCEAIIGQNSTRTNRPYRIKIKSLTYTPTSHHWMISAEIPDHYHIQFVDNSLHTITRVCLPMYSTEPKNSFIYFHTISDIIEYLERIYEVKEKGKIYAVATRKNSSVWFILKDGEKRNQTIQHYKDKQISIVFYYIKEGLEGKDFTLSVFKRSGSEEKDPMQIPLFLFPFMKCAIEALLGFQPEKEQRMLKLEDLSKKPYAQPWLYNYTKTQNNNGISEEAYSQIQKYYSNFYLDQKIEENTELCLTTCMHTEKLEGSEPIHEITWYIKVPGNPQEYTHYSFLSENTSNSVEKTVIENLLTNLQGRNLTTENPVYGLHMVEKNELYAWEIFEFRTFNETNSYLSIHDKIVKALFHNIPCSTDERI